ncbi:MAG: hypothetical protein IPM23_22470 [Candidatus Melainabacteria bacterium]|nr:hypothetical protein [Candidatus Melainabacteria bacterium]
MYGRSLTTGTLVLALLILAVQPPALAQEKKAGAGRSKAATAASYKAYFKKWFDKYYSSLYYAKSLNDIRPYFTDNYIKGWDTLSDGQKVEELARLKRFYVGDSKLEKLSFGTDGSSAEVELTGALVVDEKRGYGRCTYKMQKEARGWLINSSSRQAEYTKVIW